MPERERYPAGVPCWVETIQPDLHAAVDFYTRLFGWEATVEPAADFAVATLRGLDVAGFGAPRGTRVASVPAWRTLVRVDSVTDTVDRALAAGGRLAERIDAGSAGRGAMLIDPTGAQIGAWELGSREGAQLVDEAGAWALSLLRTDDPEAASAFYSAVFGWQAERFGGPDSDLILFRVPGYVGGQPLQPVPRDVVAVMTPLVEPDFPGSDRPHWSIDFFVGDVDRAVADTRTFGGTVIEPAHDTPGFRTALLQDPQGAVFSVSMQTRG
jgi:hypothetical protein